MIEDVFVCCSHIPHDDDDAGGDVLVPFHHGTQRPSPSRQRARTPPHPGHHPILPRWHPMHEEQQREGIRKPVRQPSRSSEQAMRVGEERLQRALTHASVGGGRARAAALGFHGTAAH